MGAPCLGVAHSQGLLGHREPAEEEAVVSLQLVDQSFQHSAQAHLSNTTLSWGVPSKRVVDHNAALGKLSHFDDKRFLEERLEKT